MSNLNHYTIRLSKNGRSKIKETKDIKSINLLLKEVMNKYNINDMDLVDGSVVRNKVERQY